MSEPHKIACAHYASVYLPLTENWIYRLLVNHQHYTPVFLSRKKKNLSLFPGITVHSLQDFSMIRKGVELAVFKTLGYFPFMQKACSNHGVRILHVHFGYHGAKLLGLAKKLGIPMVCSFYGDDAFAHHHQGQYKHLFAEADQILVLGPYMRDELIRKGCDPAKIQIHHLGIDVRSIDFKTRSVTVSAKVKFLIASSFVKKKGIDLAIRALGSLKERYSFSLDIIGDGPLRNEIQNEIDKTGLRDRVVLHGYKPYEYVINMAGQCDVLIQASRTTEGNNKEGTPMVIVDAMAAGLAVVATNHSDIPEMVKHGVNGLLAEENDVESLRTCMEELLRNPVLIGEFSLKGRAWVEQEFNATVQTAKLEELYRSVINGDRQHNHG
jgi:colanic acid/amylovoran biosynthesis glycosyltransferase